MRHYEILLLIHPDQSSQVPSMLERYQSIVVKHGGRIHRKEDWGKLQLAYQINKLYKAHYLLLNVECEQNALNELTNSFKFNDAVIRNLITNCEKAITEPSVFMQNKDNKDNNKDPEKNNAYYEAKTTSTETEESVSTVDLEIDPEI